MCFSFFVSAKRESELFKQQEDSRKEESERLGEYREYPATRQNTQVGESRSSLDPRGMEWSESIECAKGERQRKNAAVEGEGRNEFNDLSCPIVR